MSKAIKFKDVAHMYLGCKIMTSEGIGRFNALYTGYAHVSYDFVNRHLRFDEVKPVLRSLSDFTKDDVPALANKYPFLPDAHKSITDANNTEIAATVMALCREEFDLFNLIENGEAIDAATLGKEASHE